jgi:hypothetical protein
MSGMNEIRNARIEETFIGLEDHGLLTAWATLG